MSWFNPVLFIYAILNIGMGLVAYINKKSVPSLIAGVAAGALVIFFVTLAKSNPKVGYIGAGVVALLILGRFMGPLISTGKIYPAGILVAGSVIAIITCVLATLSAQS